MSILSIGERKEIKIGLIVAMGIAVIGIGNQQVSEYLSSPRFQIESSDHRTFTKCDEGGVYVFHDNCPNEQQKAIHIKSFTITNVGNKQAKNVEISITSPYSFWLEKSECPEINLEKSQRMDKNYKAELNRFSKNISCKLDFGSLNEQIIDKIIITADDVEARVWSSGQEIENFVYFMTVMIFMYIITIAILLGAIAYLTISLIQNKIKDRRYHPPTKIKSYCCKFRIEELVEKDPQKAEKQIIAKHDAWLSAVRDLSKKIPMIKPDLPHNEEIIQLKNGNIHIYNYSIETVENENKLYRVLNFEFRTENLAITRNVLKRGKLPCHSIFWELHTEFDTKFAVDLIKERLGIEPDQNIPKDDRTHDFARYNLDLHDFKLEITLSSGTKDTSGKIGLIYVGKDNKGFYSIHPNMKLKNILYFLYGEITLSRFLNIIKKMTTIKKHFWPSQ